MKTKTYTQKQMDSAKKRAYNKGYEEAKEGMTIDEAWINAHEVRVWKKWEQSDFDWTVILLAVACVGAILMMIF